MADDNFKQVIITDKKSVKYFFQTILYDSLLTNQDEIVLSTIEKYRYVIERFLIVLLKCHGWIINEAYHEPDKPVPIEEKKQGDFRQLTYLKYYFIRDPYNKEIIRTELKNRKNSDALTYLLNRIDMDRKEINEEEIIESLEKLFDYFIKKRMKK